MVDRTVVKRLTRSDCTFFEAVFRKIGAGNQKSINLNRDVLTGQLYPNLPAAAALTDNEIALPLTLYGPGARDAHNLSRKIIKKPGYKNWRLNGEFVFGPPDDPTRYDEVSAGDLAVMIFRGEAIPVRMDLILISQASEVDKALHGALNPLAGGKGMAVADPETIAIAAVGAGVPVTHPIYLAARNPTLDAAFEDAAQSGLEGTRRLLSNKGGRKISGADLARAKARASVIGQEGEGLVNSYLAARCTKGLLASYRWISAENAVSPFDFETVDPGNQRTVIDVKATAGPFENVVHISLAEIIEASADVPYRLYRVFNLNDDGASLRISSEIQPLARQLKTIHEANMPEGVRVDSFSVTTSSLQWGPEEYITRLDEEDAP